MTPDTNIYGLPYLRSWWYADWLTLLDWLLCKCQPKECQIALHLDISKVQCTFIYCMKVSYIPRISRHQLCKQNHTPPSSLQSYNFDKFTAFGYNLTPFRMFLLQLSLLYCYCPPPQKENLIWSIAKYMR